jgi:response regulator RpfG family c-di-GMP phosphodiesterase
LAGRKWRNSPWLEWLDDRFANEGPQATLIAVGCRRHQDLELPTVKEDQVRLLIAGANTDTVMGLAGHLTDQGHRSVFARNGSECRTALRLSIPELIILEFDIFWAGSDAVIEAMKNDPSANQVPVVLFAQNNKRLACLTYPKIIANLTSPVQLPELAQLLALLENMRATRNFSGSWRMQTRQRHRHCQNAYQS